MNKTIQLDSLFNKWEKEIPEYKNKFIRDGINDEALFENSSKKILFIAKEPNDPLQENSWDFRELWKNEFKHTFTHRIAEWAYGILNNFPPYDELWKDPTNLQQALHRIAFMNIKKTGGKGLSDNNEMLQHFEKNKEYLIEEIKIIHPDIIILGLSYLYEIRNGLFENCSWTKSDYALEITKWNDTKMIDFYHPSARKASATYYTLLQNIVQSPSFENLSM